MSRLPTWGLIALLCVTSFPAAAEWLASTGAGVNYNNNYSLQNGNYTNIQQSQTSRTGSELSGAVSWQQFKPEGGYSVDMKARIDRDLDTGSQLDNLLLSISKIKPLSRSWLTRLNAKLIRYNDDDYALNSFDGISLSATAGYFSPKGDGFDVKFSWLDEDHNQDAVAAYKTQRTTAGVNYFFAQARDEKAVSLSFSVQNNDSTESRRDALSLLASINVDDIWLGKNRLRITFNWRRDSYDESYTTTATDPFGPGMGSGGGFPGFGGGGGAVTTQQRVDQQLFATAGIQRKLSKKLRLTVSASAGSYSSITGDQTFFSLFSGLRWFIN